MKHRFDILIKLLRKVNINKRLIVTFSFTILLPSLIIAWSNYDSYIRQIEMMARQNLEFITEISSQLFQSELNKYENMTLQLNKNEELFAYLNRIKNLSQDIGDEEEALALEELSTQISQILFDTAKDYTYVSNLQIVTQDYQFSQTNEMGYKKGALIKDLEAFNNQERHRLVEDAKGYPIWFDTTDEAHVFYYQRNPTVTIANYLTQMRGMIDPDSKEQVAIIVLNVDFGFIRNAMDFNAISSDGNILFVSEKGPLSSLNENLNAPRITDYEEVFAKIYQASSQGANKIIDGNSIIFFKKLDKTEYYILQIVERKQLIRDALIVRNWNLVIMFMCVMIALILAYVVTRSIADPLDKLAMTMNRTTDEKLASVYRDTSKDEVAQLGLQYNKMMEEINLLIDELYVNEIKKNDAKLNALQMQINPHFMYNTLDFMRWEAIDLSGGENQLSHMISDFSKLLRQSIKRGKDIVPIQEELDHIKSYIKVANYRFEEDLDLEIIWDESMNVALPKLTLQPLVENAIIHGFESQAKDKRIRINLQKEEGYLVIEVVDNGKGIQEEKVIDMNQSLQSDTMNEWQSIGLINVAQRIRLYYGNEYGLTIDSQEGEGTKVRIRIPYDEWRHKDV